MIIYTKKAAAEDGIRSWAIYLSNRIVTALTKTYTIHRHIDRQVHVYIIQNVKSLVCIEGSSYYVSHMSRFHCQSSPQCIDAHLHFLVKVQMCSYLYDGTYTSVCYDRMVPCLTIEVQETILVLVTFVQ